MFVHLAAYFIFLLHSALFLSYFIHTRYSTGEVAKCLLLKFYVTSISK